MKRTKRKEGAIKRFRFLFISVIAIGLVFTVGIIAVLAYIFNLTELLTIYFDKDLGWFVILIWIVCSIVFGLLVSFGFSQIIMKPLNQIVDGMSLLSDGFYDVSINLGNHHALKDLAECFNKLAKELKSNEMMSNEFINNFSHELKTPLVSISGLVSLMKQKDFPESKRNEYLQIIEEEANRLASMTTNILNLSKLENQSIVTNKEEFNFSEQTRNCILLLQKKWEKKNLELSMDFDEYKVIGNMDLLKQMVVNLLDNAIKFANVNSLLYINISKDEDYLVFEVMNEGPELSKEEISMIFHKFYQGNKNHSIEGNGIGLSIVKRIVELHNGNITVVSKDGKVKFVVRLAI